MSASDKPLAPHVFSFASGHSLQVECRRLPAEVARVTQTLQLDVEELFANLLDWGGGSEPQAQASPVNDAAANGCSGDPHLPQPQQPHSDPQREQQLGSKQLCGNVANDAPDLIGLDIWPASIALCRYLAAHPYLVAGQHVLELGAGMGLPGLLSASLGAASALLTDYEPAVLTQLVENAMLNSVQQRCSSQLVDFCCPVAGLRPEQQGSWRLVLVADVLYAERIAQPLAQTLKLALHPEGVALVGHQVRRAVYLDPATRLPCLEPEDGALEAFKQCCAGCGLQLRMLSSLPTCSTVDSDPMVLLAIGPGRAALELLPGAASAPLGLTAATLP